MRALTKVNAPFSQDRNMFEQFGVRLCRRQKFLLEPVPAGLETCEPVLAIHFPGQFQSFQSFATRFRHSPKIFGTRPRDQEAFRGLKPFFEYC